MLRDFVGRLFGWLAAPIVKRDVWLLDRHLRKLEREQREALSQLEESERELRQAEGRFEEARLRLQNTIEEVRKLQEKYDREVVMLRERIEVLEDVVIPTLVAKHQLILSRLERQIAVENRLKEPSK